MKKKLLFDKFNENEKEQIKSFLLNKLNDLTLSSTKSIHNFYKDYENFLNENNLNYMETFQSICCNEVKKIVSNTPNPNQDIHASNEIKDNIENILHFLNIKHIIYYQNNV